MIAASGWGPLGASIVTDNKATRLVHRQFVLGLSFHALLFDFGAGFQFGFLRFSFPSLFCCRFDMSSTTPNPSAHDMQPGLGRTAAMLGLSAQLGGREGELQKMLIDERIKSENFRTQYQSLKEETTR